MKGQFASGKINLSSFLSFVHATVISSNDTLEEGGWGLLRRRATQPLGHQTWKNGKIRRCQDGPVCLWLQWQPTKDISWPELIWSLTIWELLKPVSTPSLGQLFQNSTDKRVNSRPCPRYIYSVPDMTLLTMIHQREGLVQEWRQNRISEESQINWLCAHEE